MGQNLVEKIAQRFAVGLPDAHTVHAGDFLSVRPARVMTHDNTAAVISASSVRTYDMMRLPGGAGARDSGAANTSEMTDAVIAKL